MPELNVEHCLRNFDDSISKALNLLSEIDDYRILQPTGSLIRVNSRKKELFAAISLLRMHLAWEDFIENVFIRYLCGGITQSGYSPVLVGLPAKNIRAAIATLMGRNNYLIWSPANIEIKARQFFDLGEPFVSTISGARNALIEINAVRNRFAHRSEHASVEFTNLVRNTFGYIPRGINPGRFLLMNDPAAPMRFIDKYEVILRVSARNIVH